MWLVGHGIGGTRKQWIMWLSIKKMWTLTHFAYILRTHISLCSHIYYEHTFLYVHIYYTSLFRELRYLMPVLTESPPWIGWRYSVPSFPPLPIPTLTSSRLPASPPLPQLLSPGLASLTCSHPASTPLVFPCSAFPPPSAPLPRLRLPLPSPLQPLLVMSLMDFTEYEFSAGAGCLLELYEIYPGWICHTEEARSFTGGTQHTT